jgi:hypothetical protein
LIATEPVPRRATVSICEVVGLAKGNDLKQIVKLPARIEYTVSRINAIYGK